MFRYSILFHYYQYCVLPQRELIVDVLDIIKNKKVQQVVLFVVISGIAFFGLVSITMLLTLNLTSSQFKVAAFIAQHLPLTTNSRY